MAPLISLYFFGVLLAWMAQPKEEKAKEDEDQEDE
jgi:hypothetical protein